MSILVPFYILGSRTITFFSNPFSISSASSSGISSQFKVPYISYLFNSSSVILTSISSTRPLQYLLPLIIVFFYSFIYSIFSSTLARLQKTSLTISTSFPFLLAIELDTILIVTLSTFISLYQLLILILEGSLNPILFALSYMAYLVLVYTTIITTSFSCLII